MTYIHVNQLTSKVVGLALLAYLDRYFLLCKYLHSTIHEWWLLLLIVYIVRIFIFWWLVRLYYYFPLSENESWSYLPTKYVTFHKIHSKQIMQFTNSTMAQLGRRQRKCLKAKEIYFSFHCMTEQWYNGINKQVLLQIMQTNYLIILFSSRFFLLFYKLHPFAPYTKYHKIMFTSQNWTDNYWSKILIFLSIQK